MTETERFERGLQVRRAVVGEDRVRTSLANTDALWRPLQEMTTSFAWGEVWTREELDRRARSIMTVGMLIALGRWVELEVHVIGALNNGVSETEIREMVLQAAVYCGFPAALEASRAARGAIAKFNNVENPQTEAPATYFWGQGG